MPMNEQALSDSACITLSSRSYALRLLQLVFPAVLLSDVCLPVWQALLAVPGVGALLDALGAYSGRHVARLDRLRRSTFLLDYTLAAMRVLAPGGEGLEEGSGLGLDDPAGFALGAAAADNGGPGMDADPVGGNGSAGALEGLERGLQGASSGSGDERDGGGAGTAAAADLPGSGGAGRGSKRKQRAGGVPASEALANGHGAQETEHKETTRKKRKKNWGSGGGVSAVGQTPNTAERDQAQVTVELPARREQEGAVPLQQPAGPRQGASKARRKELRRVSAHANGAPAKIAQAGAEAADLSRVLEQGTVQPGKGKGKGVAMAAKRRTKSLLGKRQAVQGM